MSEYFTAEPMIVEKLLNFISLSSQKNLNVRLGGKPTKAI